MAEMVWASSGVSRPAPTIVEQVGIGQGAVFGRLQRPNFTFQKIGAPNLRISRTFFRHAVG
jgi:hypothetical protein